MRRTLAVAALLCCAVCGRAPATPQETVDAYFHALARDPIRSLPLLTPGFHERHGLRFADVRDDPVIDRLVDRAPESGAWGEGATAVATDAALRQQRARLGWLTALTKRAFALRGPLPHALDAEATEGDRARVAVRVRAPGQPPFGVSFALLREGPSKPWRIDAVEIEEERNVSPAAAFLAAPSSARYARLQAALRRAD